MSDPYRTPGVVKTKTNEQRRAELREVLLAMQTMNGANMTIEQRAMWADRYHQLLDLYRSLL